MKSSIVLFCIYFATCNLIVGCSQKEEIKQASDHSCPSLPEKKTTKEHKALFAILKDRKWGFIDSTGKVVIEPQFNYVMGFIGQRAAFKASNGKWGFIDPTGKVVVEPEFDQVGLFREGKAAVKVGHNWGFVDSSGKIVVEPQFYTVSYFSEQRAAITNNNLQSGFIDPQGILVVKPSFDSVASFSEGLAEFRTKEKAGYIDSNGKIVIELPDGVNAIQDFSEGRAIVWQQNPGFQGLLYLIGETIQSINLSNRFKNKSFAGVIDKQGREIVPIKWNGFSNISSFSGCLATVLSKGKKGIIDRNGAIVVEPKFHHIGYGFLLEGFSEGLTSVTVNDKQGFINTRGEIVIEPKFAQVDKFSDGLAAVRVEKDGKWGAIDRSGNMVIEPQFPDKLWFSGGLARVDIDEKIGYIDRTGKFVWSPTK